MMQLNPQAAISTCGKQCQDENLNTNVIGTLLSESEDDYAENTTRLSIPECNCNIIHSFCISRKDDLPKTINQMALIILYGTIPTHKRHPLAFLGSSDC